ncbi:PREDICTED: N-acyl-phosphatidylethanolamine-hydrolyzing phospholipase D-like [Priapulus caudatus]|uniref:N-acyl-phosphatidylethanolamine-hydrolyzing phospholipase D-like n=1 Tax=Priapulus caudatus TaxID=37621 RepID=A0ABM1DXM9_PRICU|nr:PREDICTED: N-acyl-phosphatidylethanolamine-hydrolyzing phospholipase D-like [Priapulus caudatus]
MCPQHINPEEAVKIHMDIRANQSVAVHWGTFNLSNEPYDQPVKDLHAARAKKLADATSFIELKHGETKTFPSGASGRNPGLLLTARTQRTQMRGITDEWRPLSEALTSDSLASLL